MITCYTNDKVCKLSFLVPFCTFLLLTRMMMSMNINVGHDNVVYTMSWYELISICMDTVVIAHTVSNIISIYFLSSWWISRSPGLGSWVCTTWGWPAASRHTPPTFWRTRYHDVTRDTWSHITRVQISGASAGAGVAVALVLGVPLGDMASDTLAGETSRMFVDSSNSNISMQGFRLPGTATLDHSLPHSTSRTGSEKTWRRGCLQTHTK